MGADALASINAVNDVTEFAGCESQLFLYSRVPLPHLKDVAGGRNTDNRHLVFEVTERSDDVSELTATLVSTAIEPSELGAVAESLQASPLISQASWSSTAED
jgi:hypothetical protein